MSINCNLLSIVGRHHFTAFPPPLPFSEDIFAHRKPFQYQSFSWCGGRGAYATIYIFGGEPFHVERAGMFVLMAVVDAQELPIAGRGRVVFAIMVSMVNRQFT